jgi:Na+-transporting NADH:ubiquinone oxidoreductase subunit NqrE
MAAGETGQSLAREYGMSKSVVCEIGAGKGWIHV